MSELAKEETVEHKLLLSLFKGMTMHDAVELFRLYLVKDALARSDGHHQKAAELLALHRNTITRITMKAGLHSKRVYPKGNEAWQKLGEDSLPVKRVPSTRKIGNEAWQVLGW
jgi:hypothetical protein